MMYIIGVIPARLAASRFPNKPMASILGMPMIGHVYQRAKMCPQLNYVWVATCACFGRRCPSMALRHLQ